jgi:hypothetical protein
VHSGSPAVTAIIVSTAQGRIVLGVLTTATSADTDHVARPLQS